MEAYFIQVSFFDRVYVMRRSVFAWGLAALVLVGHASPVRAQPFKWWKSEQFRRDVGLTAEQCARIDQIFEATLPRLREGKKELDKQEAELSTMVDLGADEVLVVRQVDRVEATRASLNKIRTLMLLHMHQVLTPDQLVRFKATHDQWKKDHWPSGVDQSPGVRPRP